MPDGPIPPRAQSLDPAGAAAVPPPADRVPPPPPPSSGDTANQPDTPALVRGVQLWMALDLWSALGREPADFEAVVGIDGWADTWAELNGAVRDLVAEHAKTVSNFEEHAEVTAEQLADARRDAASWEDWGRGWKTQAEANQAERDKAWADLDRLRAGQAAGRDEPPELVSLLSKRIADQRAEAGEKFCTCESYDCHGECCGIGNCTCTPAAGSGITDATPAADEARRAP